MVKVISFFYLLLFFNYGKSQTINHKIEISSVNRFVYFIDIGKKEVESDGTYSYVGANQLQISSKINLSPDKLRDIIKKRLVDNKLNDTAYIDSNFLYLDYLKHNDTNTYKVLKPIQEKTVAVRLSSHMGKGYYDKANDIEFSYSITLVKGKWISLTIDKELAYDILGRTTLFFNDNAKKYHLFILTKQEYAYPLTNL